MNGVDAADRGAAFVCVLVLAWPDGKEVAVRGECRGVIAREPRGDNGFGYDPLFFVPEQGATMAQIAPEIKNRISHRARAAAELVKALDSMGVA